MARGPKTRFVEDALESSLENAARTFPGALNDEEIQALRKFETPLRSRLTELLIGKVRRPERPA
jgi:hypothetical protein